MRVIVLANTAWYIYNFRMNLMLELQKEGYEVVAIGANDEYSKELLARGIQFDNWHLEGASVNPLKELDAIRSLIRKIKTHKADVVLSYTPKGNIYGAIAGRLCGIAVVNNISGLGQAFVKNNFFTKFIKILYQISLQKSVRIVFQNNEDMELFAREGIVKFANSERVPGSGVDLKRFEPVERDYSNRKLTFILIARLLWDKGIAEYVEAARNVKKRFPDTRFLLLGFTNNSNPSFVAKSKLEEWTSEGVIEYLGSTKDVVPLIKVAHCVVLPSYYREGVPRSLLESASMATPIITTDYQGCRDAVDHSESGYLCAPRSVRDLEDKIVKFIELPVEEKEKMGKAARKKMEQEFDEKIVIRRYIEILQHLND